jgi:hypothetical protein
VGRGAFHRFQDGIALSEILTGFHWSPPV